ncbi:MAG: hypothetical protein GOVbin2917_7 [Prokaryotic dsDNA virus sp.]|jgi:hypothetical protein|nr:MAG: hypothetical protein GOVbin2917_7 [Prokaryotic dsDNA virus sp.]|tara:strand:- start:5503 stop:5781 length:279 start_codon:yes stop_codon:yes gene_type:complete
MFIPKDPQKKELFLKSVNTCVGYLREIDTLKEDIKQEKDAMVEMFGCTAADFNNVVKVVYDKNKVEDQVEKLSISIANAEILLGEREEEQSE